MHILILLCTAPAPFPIPLPESCSFPIALTAALGSSRVLGQQLTSAKPLGNHHLTPTITHVTGEIEVHKAK